MLFECFRLLKLHPKFLESLFNYHFYTLMVHFKDNTQFQPAKKKTEVNLGFMAVWRYLWDI